MRDARYPRRVTAASHVLLPPFPHPRHRKRRPGTPPPGLMAFYWHFTKQTLCLRLQRGAACGAGGVMAWGRGRRRGGAGARGMDLPGRLGDRRRWLARIHDDEDQSELGPLAPAESQVGLYLPELAIRAWRSWAPASRILAQRAARGPTRCSAWCETSAHWTRCVGEVFLKSRAMERLALDRTIIESDFLRRFSPPRR